MTLGPLTVSRLGLGCNNFGSRLDLAGTRRVVDAALDVGITLLDTADIYGNRSGSLVTGNLGGSERLLGEVLRGRRERVVLATKFGGDMGGGREGGSPAYVRTAALASLRRLETDRIDLLYYHWPDEVTPIAETAGAMAELVSEGLVRAIGVSNVSAAELREAAAVAPIAAVQNEYSLLVREPEREVLPLCREIGAGFVPYYPLTAGLLTGKYRPDAAPPAGARLADDGPLAQGDEVTPRASADFALIDRLRTVAAGAGGSLVDLALGWLASRPGVSCVITGATTADQVRENAAAMSRPLTDAELAAVEAAIA
ncbi:MAG TPA: aldo/keto reductase [Gaiellales bacterium]|nr:aldo/keto reductase [Gaiellales bacterium]